MIEIIRPATPAEWYIKNIDSPYFQMEVNYDTIDDIYEVRVWNAPVALGFVRGYADRWQEKVLGIGVVPWMRGKGIGSLLLSHLTACAKIRELHSLRLHVHPENYQGKRLYRSQNWVPNGTREDGYEIWRKAL